MRREDWRAQLGKKTVFRAELKDAFIKKRGNRLTRRVAKRAVNRGEDPGRVRLAGCACCGWRRPRRRGLEVGRPKRLVVVWSE